MRAETARAWKDLRDSGLLWWINRSLHLFGWAIFVKFEDGPAGALPIEVYPARTDFRGFDRETEERGFTKLTRYLHEHGIELVNDVEG